MGLSPGEVAGFALVLAVLVASSCAAATSALRTDGKLRLMSSVA